MGFFQWVLKKLAPLSGFKETIDKLQANFALSEKTKIKMPKEVVAGGLSVAATGLLNMYAIQCNLDWVMPYWVNRQYDPASGSYVPGTVLSTNITHRNWTAIGGSRSDREPVVDPAGLVTPWFDGWSQEFWIGKNNYLIVPAKNTEVAQYLVNQLPLVVSQFIKKDVRIRIEAFVSEDAGEVICNSISLENLESVAVALSLFVAIRPYNPEGISPLHGIRYRPAERMFDVDGRAGLLLPQPPDRIYCSHWEQGDAAFKAFQADSCLETECAKGLATAFAEYRLTLDAGEIKEFDVRMLTRPKKTDAGEAAKLLADPYRRLRRGAIAAWEAVGRRGIDVRLPFQKMENAFKSNKTHLYLFIDNDVITPGPYLYHHEYFRDAAYSLLALEKMGYHEETGRILLNYCHRQRRDGYYVSQNGEWDSNGEALWSFYQHYLFTRDKDFVRQIFDSAYRGFKWIERTREKDSGLLPAGFSAEHFGPSDQYYWDNFWAIAGIRGFLFLARETGKEKVAEEAESMIAEYTKAVFASIDEVRKKFDVPVIPPSPHRSLDSSIIGSICALYPLRILDPRDKRITGTLRVIREKFQRPWAFFHRVIHSGYNVYLTAQLAECYLFRKSARVLPILQWIMDNISGTGAFPEAIHPVTGGGCMGDGHHAWACADLLNLLRNMLFFEEGNRLVITPVTYHRWFESGESIVCRNAPSHFGTVNYEVRSDGGKTVLSLDCDFRTVPEGIEFSVPFRIERATVDGHESRDVRMNTLRFAACAREVIIER